MAEGFADGVVTFCLASAAEVEAAALGEGVRSGVLVGRVGLDGEEGLLGWGSDGGLLQPLVWASGTSCLDAYKHISKKSGRKSEVYYIKTRPVTAGASFSQLDVIDKIRA